MQTRNLIEKVNGRGTVYFINEKGEILVKTCTNCGESKVVSDFAKQRTGLGGYQAKCRTCCALYKKENQKHISEVNKKYRAENRERIRENDREYYSNNRDKILERTNSWRQCNLERMAEHQRNWVKRNHEKAISLTSDWKLRNREHVLKYYERTRERKYEYNKTWQRNNPEKEVMKRQRRRARKRSLPDTFTHEQMIEILAYFNGGCALTGEINDIHWDHVIPLATEKVGTVYGNMIPLRADLNMSKSDANIFEWFEANKERFNISQEKFDRLVDWLAELNEMTVEEYRAYVYECHNNRTQNNEAI